VFRNGEVIMWWKRIALLVATGLAAASVFTAESADFKVVVNRASTMTEIDVGDLSRIFLKQTASWPDGSETQPVDMAPDTELRKKFSKAVHGRDAAAIKSYWQRQIFSGKGTPPVEFSSEEDLLFFVSETPGAVGYVSDSTPLTSGVKELRVRN
jgi:hypothetical protein